MINLKCRTEYSFRTAYGTPERIIAAGGIGICDRSGTWGHVAFNKAAKKAGVKPVFGVELAVVPNTDLREKQPINWMSFLAKNNKGLQKIYELTTLATEKSYYVPRLDYSDLFDITDDVYILSGVLPILGSLPLRDNLLVELSPLSSPRLVAFAQEKFLRTIAVSDNFYPNAEDRRVYEIVAGSNKEGRTTPMHLLDEYQWLDAVQWGNKEAIKTATDVYENCNATLPNARMVKYTVTSTLEQLCIEGAKRLGIDLGNRLYSERLSRELKLIAEKEFEDYFYVIADLVRYAKENMLVGPARGSSCGSLACYLLGITDIDPLPYDLLFERFVDINRRDLPDIDIDFQDDRREMVFEYLRQKYGADCVARLGTISRYKAKSTIGTVAKELSIPAYELTDLKGAIIERSGGDSRAQFCILDTFDSLDIGRRTLEKYPELAIAADIEGHASHSGQHAAGILVTGEPLTHYCSVDKKTGAVMIDKKDAEALNLLKIDALGLRTLSVLQDCLDSVGWSRDKLLKHPLDDRKVLEILVDSRFSGIFQFEGFALQSVCRQMPIERFSDLYHITALARPGPLTSGATTEFVKRRSGAKEVTYLHPMMEESTKETYGIVIYQEQVMQISRNIGKLSWEDVSELRKAMSKSLGNEFFDGFKSKFLIGASENGLNEKDAISIWENINTMGSMGFNLSHAVAYGLVSYWCCVMKAYFPLEFAAATLRNSKDDEQVVQIIRELSKEGYEYKTFDKELSQKNWAAIDGKVIGGLLNLKGVGDKLADDILNRRATGVSLTKRQESLMENPVTPFDNIFEGNSKFGEYYTDWTKFNVKDQPNEIANIHEHEDGKYTFLGKIVTKNLRDLNENIFIQKRGGRRIEEHTQMLNLDVADDTGKIRIAIDRFKFAKLGKPLVEDGKIGEWYIWKGKVRKGFLQVQIEAWRKLA